MDMKEIIVHSKKYGNQTALIDDCDFRIVSGYHWMLRKYNTVQYAYAKSKDPGRHYVDMHRLIVGCPEGKEVDHRDHNGLNNQRANLRVCEKSENRKNIRMPITNTSGFKGVHFRDGLSKPWRVKIDVDGKVIYGGYFSDKAEAAKKYNEMAVKYYGEFAQLNNFI